MQIIYWLEKIIQLSFQNTKSGNIQIYTAVRKPKIFIGIEKSRTKWYQKGESNEILTSSQHSL